MRGPSSGPVSAGPAFRKHLKRTALLCIFLLAAGQLLFLGLIQPQLRYDPLKVFDMAVEMLRTHTISGTYETGYFARYTNNYPLTILTYWFLLLLSRLSVPEAWFLPAVQIVNVGCITLSIWLGYLIAKELKGRLFAVFYLVICVLCPPFLCVGRVFLYGHLLHALPDGDSVSLSPPAEGPRCEKTLLRAAAVRKIVLQDMARLPANPYSGGASLLCALLGFTAILGFKLRATAAIALIAVILDAPSAALAPEERRFLAALWRRLPRSR